MEDKDFVSIAKFEANLWKMQKEVYVDMIPICAIDQEL